MSPNIRCLLLAVAVTGCTGTRLYQRADRAADHGDYARAVSYDLASQRDTRALPDDFSSRFDAHVAGYVEEWFRKLGTPTDANADHQEEVVRALIAWATEEGRAVPASLGARLGELAKVRWPRVAALQAADRIDEAAALAQRMTAGATGIEDLLTETFKLATTARDRHTAAMANVPASTAALHARLAEMFGAPRALEAESALNAATRIALTISATGGALCEQAVGRLGDLLPPRGRTPATFTYRFTKCAQQFVTDSYTDVRTRKTTEYSNQQVWDLKPTERCTTVQRPSVPICDSSTDHGDYYTRNCHTETTDSQVCTTGYDRVARTERVAYTTEQQYEVRVYVGRLVAEYGLEVTATVGGHTFVLKDSGHVESTQQKSEEGPVTEPTSTDEVVTLLGAQLAATTRATTKWVLTDRANELEKQAATAHALGDDVVALDAWVEASVIKGVPSQELVDAFAARHVPRSMLEQALVGTSWSETRPLVADVKILGLPTVPEREVDEDAHEIGQSLSLTADRRATYQGAMLFGGHTYTNTDPDSPMTTHGFDIGVFGGGASASSIPHICLGGGMHINGIFDSKTSAVDAGAAFGAGLRVLGLSVFPVAGAEAHGASHADPDADNFTEGAYARQGGIDFLFGGHVTLALPYPLNVTINARALKGLPVLIAAGVPGSDTVSRMGTFASSRAEVYLGWRFIPTLEVIGFARYTELASEKGGGVWTMFGGDGDLRRAYTFGIGIGGGFDKPPWKRR